MIPLLVRSYMNEDWPCGHGRFLTPEWLRYRIGIYLRYTVPSLLKQTDQNFRVWLDCRPGSEKELEPYMLALEEAKVLVTFDRGAKYIHSLPGAPSHVHVMRIDSDDLYSTKAVEIVRCLQGDALAAQFYEGYIWLVPHRILYPMRHRSPPFYCFKAEVREDGPYIPPHQGHDSVWDTFGPEVLPGGHFCMTRHELHSGGNPLCRPYKIIKPDSDLWEDVMTRFPLEGWMGFWNDKKCNNVLKLVG